MTFTDLADYRSKMAQGRWFAHMSQNPGGSQVLISGWKNGIPLETNPTTPAIPNRLGGGTFNQPGGNWRIAKVNATGNIQAAVQIVDRLSHQGGLSGVTAPGAQTTNLPTAALTRYVSGEGVMIGLEIHTTIGTTLVDVTASYTNTTPTAGRTTEATSFGGSSVRNLLGSLILLPLQAGDTGVVSVESVTLTATTGVAGAFGVVLMKPLTPYLTCELTIDGSFDFELDMFMRTGVCPLVESGACLTPIWQGTGSQMMTSVFLIPE